MTLIIKLIFFWLYIYFRLCSKTKPSNVSYGIGQLLCFRCCSTVRLKVIRPLLVMYMDYYFLHRNKYFWLMLISFRRIKMLLWTRHNSFHLLISKFEKIIMSTWICYELYCKSRLFVQFPGNYTVQWKTVSINIIIWN